MTTTFNQQELLYSFIENKVTSVLLSHLTRFQQIETRTTGIDKSSDLLAIISIFSFCPPLTSNHFVDKEGSIIQLLHNVISKEKSFSLKMDEIGGTGLSSNHEVIAALLDILISDLTSSIPKDMIETCYNELYIPIWFSENIGGEPGTYEKAAFLLVNSIRTSNLYLQLIPEQRKQTKNNMTMVEV